MGNAASLHPDAVSSASTPLSFLWLEITGACNLECVHCYAESGPSLSHGAMQTADWKRTIDDAADLGTRTVQFIGGEPTLHPAFSELVAYAAGRGLQIEVYTNLTHVSDALWALFEEHHVSLAVSFYSSTESVHDFVTRRRGSQERTLANIVKARDRGIRIRVGIVEVTNEQDVAATAKMLRELGLDDVGVDRMRRFGRAAGPAGSRRVDELCGSCGGANAAVDPHGSVYPCVFSRWLRVGNVRAEPLPEVLRGETMRATKRSLNEQFERREAVSETPEACDPWTQCNPKLGPCTPSNPPPGPCAPVSCMPCMPSGCNPVRP